MRAYFGNALGLYPKLFFEGREGRGGEGRGGEGRFPFQLVGVIVVPNSLILTL